MKKRCDLKGNTTKKLKAELNASTVAIPGDVAKLSK